jgi:hypothetical protein
MMFDLHNHNLYTPCMGCSWEQHSNSYVFSVLFIFLYMTYSDAQFVVANSILDFIICNTILGVKFILKTYKTISIQRVWSVRGSNIQSHGCQITVYKIYVQIVCNLN